MSRSQGCVPAACHTYVICGSLTTFPPNALPQVEAVLESRVGAILLALLRTGLINPLIIWTPPYKAS